MPAISDDNVKLLLKLKPFLDRLTECDRDPLRTAKGSKNPPPHEYAGVGIVRLSNLTFGDVRKLRSLIEDFEDQENTLKAGRAVAEAANKVVLAKPEEIGKRLGLDEIDGEEVEIIDEGGVEVELQVPPQVMPEGFSDS